MSLTESIQSTEEKLWPVPEGVYDPVKARKEREDAERKKNVARVAEIILGFNDPIEDEVEIIKVLDVAIASLKNISLLLGLRKSGKSTFLSLLMGDKTGIITRSLPVGKHKILYCDNEQSGKYIRKLQNRIEHLLGKQPDHITFLRLRGKSKKERKELIKIAIMLDPEIGLVIIDNVKDICEDFNDLSEADKTITMLVQWAQEFNIHIMNVLHLNKGNGLSRGHLGSEAENKAETVLKVRKDDQNNLVVVEPEATRDRPFEKFAFYFDQDGIPVVQKMELNEKKAAKGKNADPWTYTILTHSNVLDEIFRNCSEYGYEEMWKAIKNIASKHDIKLGNNAAGEWLTYYKTEGLVTQNEKRKYVRKEL